AELEKRVDAERMMACADQTREQQAAETHAAHEDAEQDAERDGRGSNRELEELEPDNFIYESRAAGSDKEDKQRRQPAAPRIRCGCRQYVRIKLIHRWPNISEPAVALGAQAGDNRRGCRAQTSYAAPGSASAQSCSSPKMNGSSGSFMRSS